MKQELMTTAKPAISPTVSDIVQLIISKLDELEKFYGETAIADDSPVFVECYIVKELRTAFEGACTKNIDHPALETGDKMHAQLLERLNTLRVSQPTQAIQREAACISDLISHYEIKRWPPPKFFQRAKERR